MKNKCFEKIPGFYELTKSNDIKICFLHDPEFGYKDGRPKAPEGLPHSLIEQKKNDFLNENNASSFDELGINESDFIKSINGRFNYRSVEEANLPQNVNRNLGITFPQEIDREDFWVCFDIDGQDSTNDIKNDSDLKIATRYYLFQCIKEGLKKRGIKFLCNTTASNGFHIYLKTKKAKFEDHGFNVFRYPKSIELIKKICPDVVKDFPKIQAIVGKTAANGIIEVFSRGRMCVAPGSVVDSNEYKVLPDGVQDFRDVSVYDDGYIEDLIKDILLDDSFFSIDIDAIQHQNKKNQNDFQALNSDGEKNLHQTNIKNIGDLIINTFPHISGQKHYATLALGGFLYNQNISEESIRELGEYIVDNAPDDLFKNSKEVERTSGFIQVLTHDSVEDKDKKRTGLTTLKSIFKDTKVSVGDFTRILWANSSPSFHRFYPDGSMSNIYKEVVIDFNNKTMTRNKLQRVVDDEGNEKQPFLLDRKIIRHVLSQINYIDDISRSKISLKEKMPISFYLQSKVSEDRLYIFDKTSSMIEEYNSLPLAHERSAPETLSLVINEYEDIGLIGIIERSTIPGVYLSRDGKTLRRFIEKEGEVVEVFPEPPNKKKLINALKLLKQINDTYPWLDDKFATFVKLGMLLPYGYVFKSRFGSFIRGIILYGEAGTCKSSASELVEYMNVPVESIDSKELEYMLPGSEFSTVYRMGKALSSHSYPIMIEEVENVFDEAENRDLIKNSITRKFIRNPGGEKEYYSRAIPIFSANELSDEIEKSGMFRRFLILNFIEKERGDKESVEKSLSFLNENGIRNSRFKELYVISEYIFYDLYQNLEYFAYSPQKIIDLVLSDMGEYVDMDLSWLIEPQFDKYYQVDRGSESQSDFTSILDTLKHPFKNKTKIFGIGNGVTEQFLENLLKDEYPYIFRIDNRQTNGVLITTNFNDIHKKLHPKAKAITQERMVELFNASLVLEEEPSIRNLRPAGYKKRIKGVFIGWKDFCKIFDIEVDEPNKEEEE